MRDYTMFTDDLRDYIRSTSKRRGTDGTQKMVDDFDRWLNQVKAEAWDEGFDVGERDAFDVLEHPDHDCIVNPYRKGNNNEG